MDSFLIGAGTAIVTAAITQILNFIFEAKRQARAEAAELRRRAAERTEKAATTLADHLESLSRKFDGAWQPGSGPRQEDIRDDIRALRRYSLELADTEARRQIELVADTLFHVNALENMGEGTPQQIANTICGIGRQAVSDVMTGQRVSGDAAKLEEFQSSIGDYYAEPDR